MTDEQTNRDAGKFTCWNKNFFRLIIVGLCVNCEKIFQNVFLVCHHDSFLFLIIWAASWQNEQNECAPSEDYDQPGHPPSLIRVFAVHMKKVWVLSCPLSAQRRLIRLGGCPVWSESSLAAHSFCWFCHVVVHFLTGRSLAYCQLICNLHELTIIIQTLWNWILKMCFASTYSPRCQAGQMSIMCLILWTMKSTVFCERPATL